MVRGGFPEAFARNARRRAAFSESYLTSLIERDVAELAVIERRGDLRRVLALLAGRSGGLLVQSALATASSLPSTTLNRYLASLTMIFLIKQIPAWSTNATSRAVGAPKLAFVDSGDLDLVVGAVAGQVCPLLAPDDLSGEFHEDEGFEPGVDAVLETPDGRVIAIEVKAGAAVRSEDLSGLRHLADRLGSRFVAGYVLYTGGQTLPFGDRIRALPLDVLWRGARHDDG